MGPTMKNLNWKSICLALSMLLNALQGAGVVPPVAGKAIGAALDAAAKSGATDGQ